jgi:hypothetical protein
VKYFTLKTGLERDQPTRRDRPPRDADRPETLERMLKNVTAN